MLDYSRMFNFMRKLSFSINLWLFQSLLDLVLLTTGPPNALFIYMIAQDVNINKSILPCPKLQSIYPSQHCYEMNSANLLKGLTLLKSQISFSYSLLRPKGLSILPSKYLPTFIFSFPLQLKPSSTSHKLLKHSSTV